MFVNIIRAVLLLKFVVGDYWQERDAFLIKDQTKMLGSLIILTPEEEIANRVLMAHKLQEYDAGVEDPSKFNPARNFFEARHDVEKSNVFKIIQKMPKGAALHGHDFSAVSQEYFMNLTYEENLYGCRVDGELHLKFLDNPQRDAFCNWTALTLLRANDRNFDNTLRSHFFLNVSDRHSADPHIWNKMGKIMKKNTVFLAHKNVFQKHFYQILKELYEDNVKYCEYRTAFPNVYDFADKIYDHVEIAKLYQETLAQFKNDYPDFIGFRFIYTLLRLDEHGVVSDAKIDILNELHELYPDFLAGFDISGREDLGKPLREFVPYIQKIPTDIKRFFHAGETQWFGATDLNLVDAVLLNTTRIGHGLGVVKHPRVLKVIKKRKIAIEVCPISNQVLKLVDDLRNHPAVSLMAHGHPVVIGHDANTLWGTKGLSYDFYMAFMGMTNRSTDLRFLKQLALNSLEYSAMAPLEKQDAVRMWNRDWNKFITELVQQELLIKYTSDEL